MIRLKSWTVEKGVPISPVNRRLQIWRSKQIRRVFLTLEVGDSIVLPFCRDTIKASLPSEYNFVCRQVSEKHFRYWRIK